MDLLLRRHHARIWALCQRLIANDADAADACQEALVLVVRRIGTFDGRAAFTTWAHRVATNACLDELRRRSRRPIVGLPRNPGSGSDDVVVDLQSVGDRDVADAVSQRLSVDDALARLPEVFRVPVVLRDLVGHDYAEIAELLSVPAGTVRSRISRGRAQLAELLEDGNPTPTTDRPRSRP